MVATHAELAEWTGLSARGVAEAGKRGVMVKAGRHWALKASVQRYIADLQRQLRAAGGEGVAASAAAERGRLAKEQADSLALKNARLRGSLLEAAAVEREWSDILRTVRSGMLALPSRLGARLPHLSRNDLAELDREVRVALQVLGEDKIRDLPFD
jgi:phage terminase Nu1 subunit (DNA packaging protein)